MPCAYNFGQRVRPSFKKILMKPYGNDMKATNMQTNVSSGLFVVISRHSEEAWLPLGLDVPLILSPKRLSPEAIDMRIRCEAWNTRHSGMVTDGFTMRFSDQPVVMVCLVHHGFHGECGWNTSLQQAKRRTLLKGQLLRQSADTAYWKYLAAPWKDVADGCERFQGMVDTTIARTAGHGTASYTSGAMFAGDFSLRPIQGSTIVWQEVVEAPAGPRTPQPPSLPIRFHGERVRRTPDMNTQK
jgi:hypothetical protein